MLAILIRTLLTLLPLSLISTTYLYLYPIFHNCAFSSSKVSADASSWSKIRHFTHGNDVSSHDPAPFRLLALGDPQLEGDSSLLNPDDGSFPSIQTLWPTLRDANSTTERLHVVRILTRDLVMSDVLRILQSWRKRLDLLGNDYYLAHIYRTMHWYTQPTHVTVLGDLIGSQWVSDEEFERRGWRFWNRVFKHGERVEDEVTGGIHVGTLGQDNSWESRIINVAGNHDVGYAGDMSAERIERFERIFGRANWETRFILPQSSPNESEREDSASRPEIRVVVLNSLNLDTPAVDTDLQGDTYKFINDAIGASRPVEDRTTATVLLTHIPLPKDPGVCVDGPYFNFYSEEEGGGLKEQNHLSYNAGKGILEGIFGMSGNPDAPANGLGRNGIILTGHDHEGCDVYHHLSYDGIKGMAVWNAERWSNVDTNVSMPVPGLREITVRSMMGEFGGNAGLLSGRFDRDTGEWQFSYSTCSVGTQHIWWAVHILDVIAVGIFLAVTAISVQRLYTAELSRNSDQNLAKNNRSVATQLNRLESNPSNENEIKTVSRYWEDISTGAARRRRPRLNRRQQKGEPEANF